MGRDERRAPLKMPAWKAMMNQDQVFIQYAEYQLKPQQKTNSKAKEKGESIRCRVSEFAICNYPLFYLFAK